MFDDLIHKILEASLEAMLVVDDQEKIVYANSWLHMMLDYEDGELVGQPLSVLVPPLLHEIHSDHVKRYREHPIRKPMHTPLGPRELPAVRRDGSELYVEVSLGPFDHNNKQYVIVTVRDATDRRESESQLEQFGQIVDDSVEEIYVFDVGTLKFIRVNKGAIQNTGYTAEELLQMTPLDLKTSFSRDTFEKLLSPLINGKKELVVFETFHQRKNKTKYPIEVRLQKYQDYIIAIVMDITERKNVENALKESENYLRAIFEAMPECVSVLGANGIILDINHVGLDMFKVKDKKLIIETKFNLLAKTGERKSLQSKLKQALNDNKVVDLEFAGIEENTYYATRAVPLFDSEGHTVATLAITRDISDMKKAQMEIEKLAFKDTLCDVYNRRSFDDQLNRVVANYKRSGQPFGLINLDLDDFGSVNNSLGHQVGDQLICEISKRLIQFFKRDTDFVARYGGDEFVVIISGLTGDLTSIIDSTKELCDKLTNYIKQPCVVGEHTIPVTASVGLALCITSPQTITTDEILRRSDEAMYKAKKAGRNQYFFYPVT